MIVEITIIDISGQGAVHGGASFNYEGSGKKCPLGQSSNNVKHIISASLALGIFVSEYGFATRKCGIKKAII